MCVGVPFPRNYIASVKKIVNQSINQSEED